MKAAGPIPKMLENIKTLAINKSEVSGKLFRESTTVTVSMLEYKASMSRSKTPARRRQKWGVPTLILLSLSRPSMPPPRKRQETPQGEAWTWWKWVLLFPWKPGEGPGHCWLQSWGGEDWWSRVQRRAHLTQASSGGGKGRAGALSQVGLSLPPWSLGSISQSQRKAPSACPLSPPWPSSVTRLLLMGQLSLWGASGGCTRHGNQ